MVLYTVGNPINRQERQNLNDTFADINKRFRELQETLRFLTNNDELDTIIQRVETAITNAQQSADDSNAALIEVQNAIAQVNQLILDSGQLNTDVQTALNNLNEELSSLKSLGVYDANATYLKNNIVRNGRDSFISLKTNTGIVPSDDGVNWRLLAVGGMDGLGSVSTVNGIMPNMNGDVVIQGLLDQLEDDFRQGLNDVRDENTQLEQQFNQYLTQDARHITEVINIKKLPPPLVSAVGDGVADDTIALRNARDYLASLPTKSRLVFPSGIYLYSESPNWAIPSAEIVAEGEVRLRYTGTENAVIIDGELLGQHGIFDMVFGNFIIEAPSTAKNGLYVRAVHHSKINVRVRGAGTEYAGVRLEFTVCSEYNITCSANDDGAWYQAARPKYGLYATKRDSSGEGVCYSTFYNPVLEYCEVGGYINHSMGNTFLGGTMEGSSSIGLQIDSDAFANKIYGCDFEVNASHDIYCLGYENTFQNCDSYTQATFDVNAKDNVITGGSYSNIDLTGATIRNVISNVRYNRLNNGGRINDLGISNKVVDSYNVGANKTHFVKGFPMPNSVEPQVDLTSIGDGIGFYNGEVQGKTGYPASYGSLYGYANPNYDYRYSWQVFHGLDAAITYRRYAESSTKWSDWKMIQEL